MVRPPGAAEHEAAGDWVAAASAYAAQSEIVTLRAGRKRTDRLDVCPQAHGDSVPLRVTLEYADAAGKIQTQVRTLHLAVHRTLRVARAEEVTMPFSDRTREQVDGTPSIAAVRRLLGAAFDDPGLDAFCLDHFPDVYDRFGRGLRKDEKVTLLLDHVRRRGDLARLLDAVRVQEPALYARFFETPVSESAPMRDVDPYLNPFAPPLDLGPIRHRWALLVGINNYVDPAFPPLNFCIDDVLALKQALKALNYTVVALHDAAAKERLLPTRDNMEAELARLCQVAGPDDLLLVHFAGHGKLVDGRAVLITRETRVPTLARKALPLADVEQQMRGSGARRLVLTLDACHAGVEIGRDLADPAFIHHAYELAAGFALIAASTAQQVAQEWREKQHGVFTYYLLEGLSGQADRAGKGFVTVDDLKTHVLDGLRKWNVEQGGLLQEPTARTEGFGDIILADYRENP